MHDNKKVTDHISTQTDLVVSGITKASSAYCDKFPLRAAIQAIPVLGGSLDTLLAGLGAKYQYERLEHFIIDLSRRLEMAKICNQLVIEPGEPLFDFTVQVFDAVIKSRSEEKQKLFATLFTHQVLNNYNWDEAGTAARLLNELTPMHVQLLSLAMNVKPCPSPFDGLRVFKISEESNISEDNFTATPIPNLSKDLPAISPSALKMICSELIARGLLHDEGIGRWSTGNMQYFISTDMAQWFLNWIIEQEN